MLHWIEVVFLHMLHLRVFAEDCSKFLEVLLWERKGAAQNLS